MRVAIVGSRSIETVNLQGYLPKEVTEIIFGGAKGVDSCAKKYAIEHEIKLTEFLSDYLRYGRGCTIEKEYDHS